MLFVYLLVLAPWRLAVAGGCACAEGFGPLPLGGNLASCATKLAPPAAAAKIRASIATASAVAARYAVGALMPAAAAAALAVLLLHPLPPLQPRRAMFDLPVLGFVLFDSCPFDAVGTFAALKGFRPPASATIASKIASISIWPSAGTSKRPNRRSILPD